MKNIKKKDKLSIPAKLTLAAIAALLAGGVVYQIQDSSLIETALKKAGIVPKTRMEKYENQPHDIYHDLQYLTYIDSLVVDNNAAPKEKGTGNIVGFVLDKAGISKTIQIKWGVDGSASLDELFRNMYKKDRIVLAQEGVPLYMDIKSRTVEPGFIIFGQTHPYNEKDGIDFCAIISSINWFQPDLSTAIRFSESGKIRIPGYKRRVIHTTLRDLPEITYFGAGAIGNNLIKVYKEFIWKKKHPGISINKQNGA